METETIVRKDGITYTRKKRTTKNLDNSILVRLYTEELEQIKEIAELKETKSSTLIRELIRDYLKKEGK